MLKSILAVTICAADLQAVEAAYLKYLNYRVAERGAISQVLAKHWGAPALAGRQSLLLQPESDSAVFLRFVQAKPVTGYAPLKSYGWNATEIMVQDPDALAAKLADSPFTIIGPPRNLSSDNNIRAMQVIGPANELLYFTYVAPEGSPFKLGRAESQVDRVFIVVTGGPDLEVLRQFYAVKLATPVTPPIDVRISVLSKAHGLDPEQLHKLAIVMMPSRFLVELDQYPPQASVRPMRAGELPPGLSMVTFAVDSLDGLDLKFAQSPVVMEDKPYDGKRVAVTVGAAGEWIELVEDDC